MDKAASKVLASMSATLRKDLVDMLDERRDIVLRHMVGADDDNLLRRLQGRAQELDALHKLFSQEK